MELDKLLGKAVDFISKKRLEKKEKFNKKLEVAIGKHLAKLIPLLEKYYKDEWISEIESLAKGLRKERFDKDFELLFKKELDLIRGDYMKKEKSL